jgi:NAD(P)-dependent dehydrogenase (short-subunit alcohol dehydrogenase family)
VVEEIRGRRAARPCRTAATSPNSRRCRTWPPARRERWGGVHILINNAGILRDKTFAKMDPADFEMVVRVHLMGSAFATKAVWATMREQNYGRILMTTSSIGAWRQFRAGELWRGQAGRGRPCQNAVPRKARKHNIRVNSLAPTAPARG